MLLLAKNKTKIIIIINNKKLMYHDGIDLSAKNKTSN
jgi:hypothetical protein